MSDPWNLTPAQWSNVLLNGIEPHAVVKELYSDNRCAWTTALLEYTERSKSTLDLGSGRGQHSAMLALAGKETTLVDWSPENVQFSMKLFEAIKRPGQFCRADIVKPLPFKDSTFDTVFSCGVFEYFSDDEIKQILKEAFRVAKQRVIIMVPNALSIAYRVGKFYMEKKGTWEWGGERPFPTLKPYFRAAGCNHITERSIAARTSLNFLTMRGSDRIKKLFVRTLGVKDHAQPVLFKQGYLLITVGEKP
jgi:SAM-dependent methyltransferase